MAHTAEFMTDFPGNSSRTPVRIPAHTALFGTMLRALIRRIFASRWYRYTLLGRIPTALHLTPPDLWPGNGTRGHDIMGGIFTIDGQILRGAPIPNWWPGRASENFLVGLHGFDWLRDLRAVGGEAARIQARASIADWVTHHPGWTDLAWRPDVLGARIVHWLGAYDFYGPEASPEFQAVLLKSLAHQACHLVRTVPGALTGAELLGCIKALLYLGVCLPSCGVKLQRTYMMLNRELDRQILADGGQIERSPTTHLNCLRDLVDMRGLLRATGQDMPEGLQRAIDRMAPMLRFYRHGDGGLALFNHGHEGESWDIDYVLQQSDAPGRPPPQAPHSGFQRLQAGRTLILVDVGAPPPPGLDDRAHAGFLSFELSIGQERMFVNCGAHPGDHPTWTEALRATAAHNSLTIDDTNAAELIPDGGIGRRPRQIRCRREMANGHLWLEGNHDGYRRGFGLVHCRRLFLAAHGEDLRGEDCLYPASRALEGQTSGQHFTLRFHLHPAVESEIEDRQAILRLRGGTIWKFCINDGVLSIVESVYMGVSRQLQKTNQLVVTVPIPVSGKVGVKWILKRVH